MTGNMRTTLKMGQYVELTELPPPDPNTGIPMRGLAVGLPGVIRNIGHDDAGTALVCVEFYVGTVWVLTTSVRAVHVQKVSFDNFDTDRGPGA